MRCGGGAKDIAVLEAVMGDAQGGEKRLFRIQVRVVDYDGNSEFRFSRHAEASLGSSGLNSAVLRAILLVMRASVVAGWVTAVFWTRLCPTSNNFFVSREVV
jgi:hypothetical protein